MTGTRPETFGEGYRRRILQNLPSNVPEERVHVCPSGLVVIIDEAHTHYTPLGCTLCLGRTSSQDEEGYPVFAGARLLRAEEIGMIPPHLGPEVAANAWVCPQCKVPAHALMPRWNTQDLTG